MIDKMGTDLFLRKTGTDLFLEKNKSVPISWKGGYIGLFLLAVVLGLAGCGGGDTVVDPEANKLLVIGIDSADWRLLSGIEALNGILLATLVGFSVLVPYVGAAVVTVPIALIAYFQFGWGWDFGQVMIAYAVIQALDGNVLVPLLFSRRGKR